MMQVQDETSADRGERIAALLRRLFAPTHLAVVDESARHAGHAGATAGGQTHYRVTLVSAAFAGQGRVARTRLVNAALTAEFAGGLHALSLALRSPDEPPMGEPTSNGG